MVNDSATVTTIFSPEDSVTCLYTVPFNLNLHLASVHSTTDPYVHIVKLVSSPLILASSLPVLSSTALVSLLTYYTLLLINVIVIYYSSRKQVCSYLLHATFENVISLSMIVLNSRDW